MTFLNSFDIKNNGEISNNLVLSIKLAHVGRETIRNLFNNNKCNKHQRIIYNFANFNFINCID